MRATRWWKSLPGAAAAAAALMGAASPALAQQASLALDRFDPAPAGDRMFGVQSPYAAGELTPHVMLLGDYAHNPLVVRTDPGNTSAGAVVSSQLFLHLDGGLSVANRVNVNVDVPLAVAQNGDSPADGAGATFSSPSKVQFGDLRFGVRVRLFGEYHDPFQLAVGGYLWVPTGAKGGFVSTGTARGLPQLILGGRVAERLVWSAAAGPQLESAQTFGTIEQGAMLKWGAGLGFLLLDNRHLQIGPELSGAVTFRDVQKRTTNLEVLLDARYRVVDDVEIGVGAGPGLTSGIGTPDVRAIFMVAYSPEQKRDRDHDGIFDKDDACPDVPGIPDADPAKNGCPAAPPPPDRDNDRIPDKDDACPDVPGVPDPVPSLNGCPPDRDNDRIPDPEDACPDEAGPANADPKLNGCPPRDRDGDGVLDKDDACPDVKGVPTKDPRTNGCPPVDTDGDGIFDDKDACPNEKGPADPDPTKNGCPRSVRVTETEIFILEQVQFDTGKATIKRASDKLLDEVAGVVKEHPEIKRIEVQGHTDDRGLPAQNKTLSQARADAVMKALIKRGIVKGRLTARGYGQDKPIADNGTDAGRQQNRRVQFTIVEKQPKGTR